MLKFWKKLNPFGQKSDMTVGVQITDELIRFVGLGVRETGLHVYLYGEEVLSAGAVVDGVIVNSGLVGYALANLRKKYDLHQVHVALPEEQSFTFHSYITWTDDSNELQSMIEDHIVSYLKLHSKLAIDDLVCEYEIVSQEDAVYEIAVWVMPRKIVELYVEVFESAGLDPVTLEIGSRLVTEMAHSSNEDESSVIVDFGASKTHITIESGGTPIHSTTLGVGEQYLTPAIEAFLGVSSYEASRIKEKYGLLRSHKEPALLSELMQELSPIRDYIDRYYINWHTKPYKTKKERNPIMKIIVHGEGAQIAGFRDHLANATRIPAEYLNVWNKVMLPEDRVPELSFDDSLRYATAVSAALHAMKE